MARKHTRVKQVILAILVCALAGSYAAYACTQPLAALAPTPTFAFSRAAKEVSLAWPSYGEAALGAVGYGVLAEHGAEKPLPTASVAKIVTALCVLQQKPLPASEDGPTITLTATDVASYNKYIAMDGSVVRVAIGEQLTERQALEALLLPSANNIAETLARWAFGSINAYNAYANTYVLGLGMDTTTITDPSGFLPSTASSPHDLVLLGIAAMRDPIISGIVAMRTANIPVQGTIHNVNVLLGQDGIVGIKTGNNDQDQGCFLFAAQRIIGTQSVTVVGAIMDGPNLGTAMWDALPLIRSAGKNFSPVTVVKAGDKVGSYQVPWGKPVAAIANSTISLLAWNGIPISASIDLQTLHAPARNSANIGTLSVNASQLYTSTLQLNDTIDPPNFIWRLAHAPEDGL